VFLFHGAHKTGLLGEKSFAEAIEGAVGAAEKVGFAPPELWGYALAFTELIGGLCLVIGLMTRYAALSLGFIMVVAAVKVHGPNGFSIQEGGMEYNLVLLAGCLALLVQGAGKWALDEKAASWLKSE
jgi:putative oxidoreductase